MILRYLIFMSINSIPSRVPTYQFSRHLMECIGRYTPFFSFLQISLIIHDFDIFDFHVNDSITSREPKYQFLSNLIEYSGSYSLFFLFPKLPRPLFWLNLKLSQAAMKMTSKKFEKIRGWYSCERSMIPRTPRSY